MKEIWKDIEGFEGYYQVSNLGRVKSLDREIVFNNGKSEKAKTMIRGRILSITKQTQGYSQVGLCKNGTQKSYRLNRLVAKAFIPNPFGKPEVNHIDGNKDNNRADNLEWVTSQENSIHALKNGLITPYKRPVLKIGLDGTLLDEYESLKEAAEKNGISRGNLCMVCKGAYGRNTIGGYIWKYKYEQRH